MYIMMMMMMMMMMCAAQKTTTVTCRSSRPARPVPEDVPDVDVLRYRANARRFY